ncbi:hypothetical protein G4B88_008159, partial [Cannabis sativa]
CKHGYFHVVNNVIRIGKCMVLVELLHLQSTAKGIDFLLLIIDPTKRLQSMKM